MCFMTLDRECLDRSECLEHHTFPEVYRDLFCCGLKEHEFVGLALEFYGSPLSSFSSPEGQWL